MTRVTQHSIGTRTYTLAEPDGDPARLLLVFHGSGQNAAAFRKVTGNAFDTLPGTTVAYLDGYRRKWNDARRDVRSATRRAGTDDVAFAAAVAERHAAGRSVHGAGYSNGGGMIIRLLHQRPGLLTGATIIAAGQPAPDDFLLPGLPYSPTPLLLFHGTGDAIVPYEGGPYPRWAQVLFGVRGSSLSAPDTAAYFAGRNGITTAPVSMPVPPRDGKPGRTTMSRTDHRQDGRAPVTLYTVHDGGHTVPGPHAAGFPMGSTGHDVYVTEAMTSFFGF